MIILLIVETSLIVFFVVVSGQGRQAFPSLALSFHLKPGCSDLTATMVSSIANNRTFEYSCSGSEPCACHPQVSEAWQTAVGPIQSWSVQASPFHGATSASPSSTQSSATAPNSRRSSYRTDRTLHSGVQP